jgi:hypothetical protein
MAVRLEEDVAEPAHRHDALAAERGVKLGPAEPLAREVLPQDLAVPDQDRRRVPLIRRAPSADQRVPLRATGEWSERSEANTRTGTESTQREARSYAASRVYR